MANKKPKSNRSTKAPQTKVDRHSEHHSNKAFQQHDVKNRLGDYVGDGNHARVENPGKKSS